MQSRSESCPSFAARHQSANVAVRRPSAGASGYPKTFRTPSKGRDIRVPLPRGVRFTAPSGRVRNWRFGPNPEHEGCQIRATSHPFSTRSSMRANEYLEHRS